MVDNPSPYEKRIGTAQLLRWTTLVDFGPAKNEAPGEAAARTVVQRFIAQRARRILDADLEDRQLVAFLLFEASKRVPILQPTSRKDWSPLIAARHLFGLEEYWLKAPNEPLSEVGKSLEDYWREYLHDSGQDVSRILADPLDSDSWGFRQTIASGESGLNTQRKELNPKARRMGDVANALFGSTDDMLSDTGPDVLAHMIDKWRMLSLEVRSKPRPNVQAGPGLSQRDRDALALRMWRAAYRDYEYTQSHRRRLLQEDLPRAKVEELIETLWAVQQERRTENKDILKEIDMHFGAGSDQSIRWHNVIDRLRVLWYSSNGRTGPTDLEDVRTSLGTPEHSGLSPAELHDLDALTRSLEGDIDDAMRAVRTSRLSPN